MVLAGASAAGKSTWAEHHFKPTQIVSTDRCRALVGDREDVQAYSPQAFELFYFLIEKRMELNKLVVADSTALDPAVRRRLLGLAREHAYPAVLVAFDAGLAVRTERNRGRGRRVPQDVLERQGDAFGKVVEAASLEGWDEIRILSPEEAETMTVTLEPLSVFALATAPFDVVGDVHGCYDELVELLGLLGWEERDGSFAHPQGRTLVSLGDLADRGPRVADCFRLLLRMVRDGRALFTPGNHDDKLARCLLGRPVKLAHGLQASLDSLQALPEGERETLQGEIVELVRGAPPYLILDRRKLVVAHAGIKREMIGKLSHRIRVFTLYGDVTGERTPEGLPVRRDWAAEYHGRSLIAYGHTPVPDPVFRRNTVNLDQGCVFGGKLTALRYPELEFVQAPARRTYYQRPGGVAREG